MARKIHKKPTAAKRSAPAGADDLSVLHPDATPVIAGRRVPVKEYRFLTGLHVRAKALPLTTALRAQIETGSALDEEIIDVLAQHVHLVRELILISIVGHGAVFADEAALAAWEASRAEWAAWIDGLDGADGEQLLMTWWSVCGPFFVRTIVRWINQKIQLTLDLAARDGATSMPASPAPATAMPTDSDTTTPIAN